jgi:CO/xanthine dehydrogenase FAD-binding subunit
MRIEYHRPRSLEEAWDLKIKIPDARFVAGGTDVLVQIKNRVVSPPALISLRSIPKLSGVEPARAEGADGTRIGALTTITDIVNHPELGATYPVLIEAARRLGSTQIRNVATIGGNLCNASPCSDTALPLLVLDARVRLEGPDGSRELSLSRFFTGPGETCLADGEILTAILLDGSTPGPKAAFLKKGRVRVDLAIASVAVLLELSGGTCRKVRCAAGSVAPAPVRLVAVEEFLEGAAPTRELLTQAEAIAAESVSPISDVRASAEYRRQIAGVYVRRAVERLLEPDRP